jgi:hypothetical protein
VHSVESGSLTDAATAYMDMKEEGVLPLANTYEVLLMAAMAAPPSHRFDGRQQQQQRSAADDPNDVLSLEFLLRVLADMRRAGCQPGVELYNTMLLGEFFFSFVII